MLNKINKKTLTLKIHYFLYNAGTAPVVPFLSTYARQLGFSPVVVGLIYTILPICGMIVKPVVGSIADHYSCRKSSFLIGMLITAAAFLAINFSPEVSLERKVHFSFDGRAVFDTSPINSSIDTCLIAQLENDLGVVDCHLNCPMEESFWPIIIEYWHVEKFNESHPSNLEFIAHVNKSLTKTFNNVAIFVVRDITIDGQIYSPSAPFGRKYHISTVCDIECLDYNIQNIVTKSSISDVDVYKQYQFWTFLLLMIIGWIGQAITVSVGDTICFEMLGDKPNQYGYQRMFGALGWGIFSIIAGLLVDASSVGSASKNFEYAFYLAVFLLLLDFLISSRIKYVQTKLSTNILKDIGQLLWDVRIMIFLLCCIAVGMCTGLIWQFLFFLIEDLAKDYGCDSQRWIKTLEGLVMGVQTLAGEMPFFFLSGKILKRIGHTHSMSLVFAVIGVRYILYSIISNPWWFLPLELLNGLTFGLFYACMASYASIVAPSGTEATMQGLVGAIFEGVGVSCGSIVGGLLYDSYGGVWTFRLFGISALLVFLFHVGVQWLLNRTSKSEKQ